MKKITKMALKCNICGCEDFTDPPREKKMCLICKIGVLQ